MSLRPKILAKFEEVATSQEMKLAPLHDELALQDCGLDSLCIAIIVASLEDELGFDPFGEAGDDAQAVPLPVTFGDFVRSYDNVAP
jgi:hypothetical protein